MAQGLWGGCAGLPGAQAMGSWLAEEQGQWCCSLSSASLEEEDFSASQIHALSGSETPRDAGNLTMLFFLLADLGVHQIWCCS